jgi:hypothetical protein
MACPGRVRRMALPSIVSSFTVSPATPSSATSIAPIPRPPESIVFPTSCVSVQRLPVRHADPTHSWWLGCGPVGQIRIPLDAAPVMTRPLATLSANVVWTRSCGRDDVDQDDRRLVAEQPVGEGVAAGYHRANDRPISGLRGGWGRTGQERGQHAPHLSAVERGSRSREPQVVNRADEPEREGFDVSL